MSDEEPDYVHEISDDDAEYFDGGDEEYAEEADAPYLEDAMEIDEPKSKRKSSSNSQVHSQKVADAEDIALDRDSRVASVSSSKHRERLLEIYNRERRDFQHVEEYNAYKEQQLRFVFVLESKHPEATSVLKQMKEDSQFDETDIQARNRRRKRDEEGFVLTAKRQYIMEEYKRVNDRRDSRISLLHDLTKTSFAGRDVVAVWTAFTKEAQNRTMKILADNKATLNPIMGTGNRRDLSEKAAYLPTSSQSSAQKPEGPPLPSVIQEMKRDEMSPLAVRGSGWKQQHLVKLSVLQLLGGFKVGHIVSAPSKDGSVVPSTPGGPPAPPGPPGAGFSGAQKHKYCLPGGLFI